MERTPELLKRKFQELISKLNPTDDPNCPPYVREAKQISRKIVIATNGLTGGLSVAAGSITSNEESGGGENGMDKNGMDEEEDKDAKEVEAGVSPPILPPIIHGNSFESAGDNNDEGEINSSHPTNKDDDDCRDPSAAAAMPSSQARGGGEKQKAGDGANPEGAAPFLSH